MPTGFLMHFGKVPNKLFMSLALVKYSSASTTWFGLPMSPKGIKGAYTGMTCIKTVCTSLGKAGMWIVVTMEL